MIAIFQSEETSRTLGFCNPISMLIVADVELLELELVKQVRVRPPAAIFPQTHVPRTIPVTSTAMTTIPMIRLVRLLDGGAHVTGGSTEN